MDRKFATVAISILRIDLPADAERDLLRRLLESEKLPEGDYVPEYFLVQLSNWSHIGAVSTQRLHWQSPTSSNDLGGLLATVLQARKASSVLWDVKAMRTAALLARWYLLHEGARAWSLRVCEPAHAGLEEWFAPEIPWMFQDRYAPDDGIQLVETGHSGQSIKLRSNCFRLYWPKESFGIHHYRYQLSDPTVTPKVERSLLESAWPQLKSYLGPTFCVRAPGHIFTPATGEVKSGGGKVETFRLPLELQLEDGTNLEMKVTWAELIAPDEIHGDMGPASVVMNHIVNQLAASRNVQKVGKRHYDTTLEGAKGHHEVISAFSINMVASCVGPLMQLDVMHRPVGRKTLVDVISANMEGTDILQHQADKEIEKEWLRCCVSATVVTSYNNRPYRIKKVHFDKNPSHVFQMYEREARQFIEMSLEKYVEVHYNRKIHMKRQPLLEAFPEKASETVLLLPELCLPTGVNEEIRRDKNPLGEALKQLKVSPQERFNTIVRHAAALHSDAADLCHSWGCSIQKLPLEVEARQLEPLQVAFHEKHDKKSYSVEDGNFSRWLRNGLLCPVTIDNWLLLYPHADEPVLEIWLRSLKDIAKVAFGMA
ncbi:unnamed protein product [Effrenium voratum]|nr:unnamed protein product [Effrenium voratum]